MAILLAENVYNLSACVTGTIKRNRIFFSRLFGASLKWVRRNVVKGVQFLLLPFVKRSPNVFICFSCPLGPRWRILNIFMYDTVNKTTSQSLPLHRAVTNLLGAN
jgi:hypothetical protein